MSLQYKYLIKVDPNANNNKFYEMQENTDGTFTATYGRVTTSGATKRYQMNRWDSVLRSKLSTRKGYKDVTDAHANMVPTDVSNEIKIKHASRVVKELFAQLQSAATTTIQRNYNTTAVAVTQVMIDDAQRKLNTLVALSQRQEWDAFNAALVDLFHIIPRKMQQVGDHILDTSSAGVTDAGDLITNEQMLLDTMKGQVVINATDNSNPHEIDLIGSLGLEVREVTVEEERQIKKQLGRNAHQYRSAVAVTDKVTNPRFEKYVAGKTKKETRLLWHGSRSENWTSILASGLVLNPTNAVITGKMFGQGLYFAPKAQKSIGYSSLNGSYWTGGTARRGYLALFEVHMGNTKIVHRHTSQCSSLTNDKMIRDGYDSLHAQAGHSLRNDEIIVYDQAACTVKFIVELTD